MNPHPSLHRGPWIGIIALMIIGTIINGCGSGSSERRRPDGWTEETHGSSAVPNYAVIFPENEVKRLDITIAPENWQVMWDDMTARYGEFGQGSRGTSFPLATERVSPSFRQQHFDPEGENPVWVPCTVEMEGRTWWYVGIRFKGQSSLRTTWSMGIGKLPFRLDFDEFEDEYPAIDNQRFYGFEKLSLSNGFQDPSLLREKVAHDIFREAGVPAPRTAFYRVYIDCGEGSTYFGLYTTTEIPDHPMLQTQFGDSSGNLYKGTSTWVWFDEESFDKETNEAEGDWSDVEAAMAALHADRSEPEIWRAGLEAVFNVDGFLRWLAVNTLLQNWDSYGNTAQNYYLYGDPADEGCLVWIPWDNNEALNSGSPGGLQPLSLELAEVGNNWPLIRYLADDPVYWATYVSYVGETIEGAFAVGPTQARLQAAHDLIASYVVGSDGEQPGYTFLTNSQEFDEELNRLFDHVVERNAAAVQFLNANP